MIQHVPSPSRPASDADRPSRDAVNPGVLGLQLFTVWEQLEQNVEATLGAVAAAGYSHVETQGAFARDPLRLRRMLDSAGLCSHSQHVMPGDMYPTLKAYESGRIDVSEVFRRLGENFDAGRMGVILDEAIGRARALGQTYLVWSSFAPTDIGSRGHIRAYCDRLNAAGRQCAAEGMRLAVHNHSEEFHAHDGFVPYDLILEQTDPSLVWFELDLCWATVGGADPVSYLRRHPGRIKLLHLKDCDAQGRIVHPGDGVIDFDAVFDAASAAGVDLYLLEYDHPPEPLQTIQSCARFFAKWLGAGSQRY